MCVYWCCCDIVKFTYVPLYLHTYVRTYVCLTVTLETDNTFYNSQISHHTIGTCVLTVHACVCMFVATYTMYVHTSVRTVKPVLKTTCVEGSPVHRDHCRLMREPLNRYYYTSSQGPPVYRDCIIWSLEWSS